MSELRLAGPFHPSKALISAALQPGLGASAGAAGCWVQCCPSQGSGPPWPCLVYDVFWLLSFGF